MLIQKVCERGAQCHLLDKHDALVLRLAVMPLQIVLNEFEKTPGLG